MAVAGFQVEMCENFGIEIDASSAGALQVWILVICTNCRSKLLIPISY